jgi:hypothetical protein
MSRANEIVSCLRLVDFAPLAARGSWTRDSARLRRAGLGHEAGRGVRKWGLLLPGAPEPRLTLLRRQGFRSAFQTALRGLSNRSIVVVCNYGLARYRWYHAEQKHALYALVDPSSPPPKTSAANVIGPDLVLGGGAGYCPRVRKVYYDGHLSPYPACAGTSQYRHRRLTNKDPIRRPRRPPPVGPGRGDRRAPIAD